MTLEPASAEYSGSSVKPTVTVKVDLDGNGTKEAALTEGKDYRVTISQFSGSTSDIVNAGTYWINIIPITDSNYTSAGGITKTFRVSKAEAAETSVKAKSPIIYDGSPVNIDDDFTLSALENARYTYKFFKADRTTEIEAPTDAGDYVMKVSFEETTNYLAKEVAVPFSIQKRIVKITPAADNKATYGDTDAPSLGYTAELSGTGTTGFIGTQAEARAMFGDVLSVGSEISTTNIQHADADDTYTVGDPTNDAGTYAYNDLVTEKQTGEITGAYSNYLPFWSHYSR